MNQIFRHGFGFLLFLGLQIFLFNHLILFDRAVPFVFLLFLFMLPMTTPRAVLLLVAFLMGLCVDIFSDHMPTGLHAFSAVLAVSFRYYLVGFLSSSNFRGVEEVDIRQQNSIWTLTYLFPLILIHHIAYFLLEDFTFQRFLFNLWKALLSGIYTFSVSFLMAYVFYKR